MSNSVEMLSVDKGLEQLQDRLPRFKVIEPSKMELREVKGTKVTIDYEGEEIEFPHKVALRLRSLVGIDATMTSRLSRGLQEQVFDELKRRGPERIFARMRGNEVLKLTSDEQIANIPYKLLVDQAIEVVNPIGIANIVSDRSMVGIGLVTDRVHEAPEKQGDVLHSGIYLSMNGGVIVSEYNLRQTCINGMIGLRHEREVSIPVEEFASVCSKVVEGGRLFTDRFLTLAQNRLEDSGALVGHLRQTGHLNDRQIGQVVTRLVALEDDATEFDLVNSITTLQHEKPNSLSWLVVGGRIARSLCEEHCSRCGA